MPVDAWGWIGFWVSVTAACVIVAFGWAIIIMRLSTLGERREMLEAQRDGYRIQAEKDAAYTAWLNAHRHKEITDAR